MKKSWIISILIISFGLLATLESDRILQLHPFFKAEKTIKLTRFSQIKSSLSAKDQELLELWESMLTGRVGPVSKWMKKSYRQLGLSHIFTPSGFHLSAVLLPMTKFIKNSKIQLSVLFGVGVLLFFLPGQAALKRMIFIKSQQKIFGLHSGFIVALVLDCFFGTFQNSTLSFSYSFLFLGIIYSGAEGIGLTFWFFLAQIIVAYFQGTSISPLLIFISPILNLGFALSMPFLFFLAFPLWPWQLHSGLFILRILQSLVNFSAELLGFIPMWEIHFGFIILIVFFLYRKWNYFFILIFFLSSSLNLDNGKTPSVSGKEFIPKGEMVKHFTKWDRDLIYYTDGKCERRLVKGYWWEKCSPVRKSTRKKIMKL